VVRISIIATVVALYLWYSYQKKYTTRQDYYFLDSLPQESQNENGRYYYLMQHNNKAKLTTITTYVESIYGYDFYLKIETRFERFLKSLGIDMECQTADKEFDETVFIVSDDDEICNILKTNEQLCKALHNIFTHTNKLGFSVIKIECFDGKLAVISKPKSKKYDKEIANSYPDEIAPMLQEAAKFFAPRQTVDDKLYRERSSYIALVFKALAISLLVNGLAMLYIWLMDFVLFPRLIHPQQLLTSSIIVSLLLLIAFIATAFYLLQKSSRFAPVLLELSTLGLLGIFLSSATELWESNIYLDNSVAQTFEATVVDKSAQRYKKAPTTHRLHTLQQNNKFGEATFVVDYRMYNEAETGDTITVYRRDGFWGYAYIQNITLQKAESNILKAKLQKAEETRKKEIKDGKYWDEIVAEANGSKTIR
jgi:hypothetical protein